MINQGNNLKMIKFWHQINGVNQFSRVVCSLSPLINHSSREYLSLTYIWGIIVSFNLYKAVLVSMSSLHCSDSPDVLKEKVKQILHSRVLHFFRNTCLWLLLGEITWMVPSTELIMWRIVGIAKRAWRHCLSYESGKSKRGGAKTSRRYLTVPFWTLL